MLTDCIIVVNGNLLKHLKTKLDNMAWSLNWDMVLDFNVFEFN